MKAIVEKRSIIRHGDQYYAVFVEDNVGFNCKGGLPELEKFLKWSEEENIEIVLSEPDINGFFRKGLDTWFDYNRMRRID